eukprot:3001600-Rhodomonas_salina.5
MVPLRTGSSLKHHTDPSVLSLVAPLQRDSILGLARRYEDKARDVPVKRVETRNPSHGFVILSTLKRTASVSPSTQRRKRSEKRRGSRCCCTQWLELLAQICGRGV